MVRVLIGDNGIADNLPGAAGAVNTGPFLLVPGEVLIVFGLFPVEIVDSIGTGHLAEAAADTAVKVGEGETVLSLEPGPHRAYFHTGRIITVHAGPGHELPVDVGILSFHQAENVHPEHPLAGIVFYL